MGVESGPEMLPTVMHKDPIPGDWRLEGRYWRWDAVGQTLGARDVSKPCRGAASGGDPID